MGQIKNYAAGQEWQIKREIKEEIADIDENEYVSENEEEEKRREVRYIGVVHAN